MPFEGRMELESLKELLGVGEESLEGDDVLSEAKWELINEREKTNWSTRLMQAAGEGSLDCVQFLLKYGAEIDARDKRGRLAINYSIKGQHTKVTCFLLEQDSILPNWEENALGDIAHQCDNIGRLLRDRDDFHRLLKEGTAEGVEEHLSKFEEFKKKSRWVNSRGKSALYTAAKGNRCDVWALLRSKGFVYATEEEESEMKAYDSDESFHRAIGRYFVDLEGCHVEKMVAKSKVYGVEGVDRKRCGEKVIEFFRDINTEEHTSCLLRCLQDDPSLQIIFDFSSADIHCMKPSDKSGVTWGMADFGTKRVYVGAKETEKFSYSDVVSNLVHELAHYALSVVFMNNGMPYSEEDEENKKKYKDTVAEVSQNKNTVTYDEIINRALKKADLIDYELIVRVPEIIVKCNDRKIGNNNPDSGRSHLERQVPQLLIFYEESVIPKIDDYIFANKTANKTIKSGLLSNTELLTSHYNREIKVSASVGEAQPLKHNHLQVLKVSNLTLGASHIKLSHENLTFVDWSKYETSRDFFINALDRDEIKTLVIIWDKQEKPFFCSSSVCSNSKCVAKTIEKEALNTVLVIPKEFSVTKFKEKSEDYAWTHLSDDTKSWIKRKKLIFEGKPLSLEEIVGYISGSETVDKKMEQLLGDASHISTLIDHDCIHVGRNISSILKDRISELLRKHLECYIDRRLKLRPVEFNRDVYVHRDRDLFFIMNAKRSELEKIGISDVCYWDGNGAPDNTRCFLLSGQRNLENEDNIIGEILKRLLSSGEISKDGRWNLIHLFKYTDKTYVNLCSVKCGNIANYPVNKMHIYTGFDLYESSRANENEAIVIADVPGSGKSLFVQQTALSVWRKYPDCWIDVVELPIFQSAMKEWKEADLTSKEKVLDHLYDLIKIGDSAVERNIFKHFCNAEKKVVIFFDGFDEICPSHRENVTLFLKTLVCETSVRVFLTTRLHESSELEKHLETFAYSFLPFKKEEQKDFIDKEWNASIRHMKTSQRKAKIESIILALTEQDELKSKTVVEELKRLNSISEGGGKRKAGRLTEEKVNFGELAEELIKLGKSVIEEEGELSETPLHTWMLAYVAFEKDFHFEKFDYLSELYEQFVGIKIKIYGEQKHATTATEAGKTAISMVQKGAYNFLKEFSANFFLEKEKYILEDKETYQMFQVGFIAQRDKMAVFVHRTFGEYFFSLWLLEKANEDEVTRVWLEQVLLAGKFEKVRQFTNSLLLLKYAKKPDASKGDRIKVMKTLLNIDAFDSGEGYVTITQKGLFTCVLECKEGILKYLVESSKQHLAAVMFGKISWDIESVGIELSEGKKFSWNAFLLCGRCITGEVNMKRNTGSRSRIDYLQFIKYLLKCCGPDKGL